MISTSVKPDLRLALIRIVLTFFSSYAGVNAASGGLFITPTICSQIATCFRHQP
jgi:hypothetical protein